jgi:hypothetical protein
MRLVQTLVVMPVNHSGQGGILAEESDTIDIVTVAPVKDDLLDTELDGRIGESLHTGTTLAAQSRPE